MQTVKNTGMAFTLDIGHCDFIHPREKRRVGEHLAYWAVAKTYNVGGMTYSGPVYSKMKITSKGKVVFFFDYCKNGLTSFEKVLSGFEVAGEDKVFHPVSAEIENGKKVIVFPR